MIGIFLAIILFVIVRRGLKNLSASDGLDRKFIREEWKKIEELPEYGKEMNYKLAVIEADKLLDFALKEMYFPGETMADRLKIASCKFPKLREVWWAHKVRNHVVHDSRYHLKHGETRKVLTLFKRALKELTAL